MGPTLSSQIWIVFSVDLWLQKYGYMGMDWYMVWVYIGMYGFMVLVLVYIGIYGYMDKYGYMGIFVCGQRPKDLVIT